MLECDEREPLDAKAGGTMRARSEYGDAMSLELCDRDEHRRSDDAEQCTRYVAGEVVGEDHEKKDHHRDAKWPGLHRAKMRNHLGDAMQIRAAHRCKAEEVRKLVDDDDDRHPTHETGDDRTRE